MGPWHMLAGWIFFKQNLEEYKGQPASSMNPRTSGLKKGFYQIITGVGAGQPEGLLPGEGLGAAVVSVHLQYSEIH